MKLSRVSRAVALLLVLCLTALDAAPHVHLSDSKTSFDCSLCASGGHAKAAVAIAPLAVVPQRHTAPGLRPVVAPHLEARFACAIRGPPVVSVA